MKLKIGSLIVLLLLSLRLFASVSATLDTPIIYKGESAILNIKADGDDIEFPDIKKIGGFRILSSSTSQNITSINGRFNKSITKSYTFLPDKNVTIPPFHVKVDGKVYKTKALKLTVKSPSSAPKDESVQLILKSDKNDVYVGENLKVDLIFKNSIDQKFDKIELTKPNFEGFWSKQTQSTKPYPCGDFICQKYSFIITPQKEGNFTIGSVSARVGKYQQTHRGGMFDDPFFDDPFFNSLRGRLTWKTIYSNPLHIRVKKLPLGLDLYGDFKIEAKVDKKEVKANKPVNLTIKVTGSGNIEDIDKFDLDIKDAVVYSDEPKIDTHIEKDKSVGEFVQKIAIVADKDYTIPSFKLRYFDKGEKKEKIISTDPIDIKVIGAMPHEKATNVVSTPKSNKSEVTTNNSNNQKIATKSKIVSQKSYNYLYWLLFYLAGIITALAYFYLKGAKFNKKRSKDIPLEKRILNSKDDKSLFSLLLPYANRSQKIKDTLKLLEENIYKGKSHKVDKELLNDILDELEDMGEL